jgi:cytochrome c oxidase accessory protein FixG
MTAIRSTDPAMTAASAQPAAIASVTPPASRPGAKTLPDEARSILSTLNDDGSRRWLKPKPSPGRLLTARRIVAYGLIALFALLPLIHVNGRPLVMLDLIARRFHIFGTTFYPTDTLLLALLLVGTFLTIFWLTALFGRVWCGWACPQTVYMEFVYRPIERFFEGTPGRAPKGWLQTSGFGKILKYGAYLLVSLALAHTFLAYFVSWDNLRQWVFGSPLDHMLGFGVVMLVTVAMMADFSYFREQICLVACPYGRLQSVLLDRQSMVVKYDHKRGEPRGRKKGVARADVPLPVLSSAEAAALAGAGSAAGVRSVGDCVDCHMCVTTCPTGIDIRNGLQMECVNCAQCIDACNTVMTKLGRPTGLIRYSSQAAIEGAKFSILRPRVLLYPAIILVIAGLFAFTLINTGVADITVLRGLGLPFKVTPAGEVENNVRVKIVNRLPEPATFSLTLAGVPGARLAQDVSGIVVEPGQMLTTPSQIFAPAGAFEHGRARVMITVTGPQGFSRTVPFTLVGPASGPGKENAQ